ncbi:MAG TPA: hypothetical protein VJL31_14575 [Gemmatimonadales bacterium]|nr:hypothetical protein [Gemmatimonadales bacterium]
MMRHRVLLLVLLFATGSLLCGTPLASTTHGRLADATPSGR